MRNSMKAVIYAPGLMKWPAMGQRDDTMLWTSKEDRRGSRTRNITKAVEPHPEGKIHKGRQQEQGKGCDFVGDEAGANWIAVCVGT